MENFKNHFFAKQDNYIALCSMDFNPVELIELRKKFYDKYGKIQKFEMNEKQKSNELFMSKNGKYYAIVSDLEGKVKTYYEPNALAEYLLFLAFPTIPSISQELKLAHFNAMSTYNALEQFDLNALNKNKNDNDITIYKAKDYLGREDFVNSSLNTLQSTLWMSGLMEYEPKSAEEKELKGKILKSIYINKEKLAADEFEKKCETFFDNNVLKYYVNLLEDYNKINSKINVYIPEKLDVKKTQRAKSILMQSLPSVNKTNVAKQTAIKC